MVAEPAEQVSVVEIPEKLSFFLDPHRIKVAWGGRGSAKSWTVERLLLQLGRQKKLKILCGREYQNSLDESVKAGLEKQIGLMGLDDHYTSFKSEVVGANGTRFIFAGMRTNPRSIKSMEDVDIAWIEEAENVSKESWDLLIPTIRKEGSEIWITFNPNFSSDETYQRWVVNPPDYAKVIQMNWRDNPWFNNILQQEMKECKRKSHSDYLHTWEGVPKDKAGTTKLKLDWLQPWPAREWTGFNVYITVDPANSKGSKSDWTVMTVWGLGPDGNYYVIKWLRDRFNTMERVQKVFDLVETYRPIRVGWEHTGMSGDIDVIKYLQEQRNFRFPIVAIKPPHGVTKEARIEAALLPMGSELKLYIPDTQVITTLDGRTMDLVQEFKREWEVFPHADGDLVHDDILDSMAMVRAPEMEVKFPTKDRITVNDMHAQAQKKAREYNPMNY